MKIFLRRLNQSNRLSFFSLWLLLLLYTLAILADFIAPYPYGLQHRDYALCPPTIPHIAYNGKLLPQLVVYQIKVVNPAFKEYSLDSSRKHSIRFFVKGEEREIFGFLKTERYLFGVKEPGKVFLFGTDIHGRDVFSRVLHGARISLSIGIIGVSVSFILGLLVGGVSGYFGGKTDTVLMRTVEIIMMFPFFYLMLALRAAFPPPFDSCYFESDRLGVPCKDNKGDGSVYKGRGVRAGGTLSRALLLQDYHKAHPAEHILLYHYRPDPLSAGLYPGRVSTESSRAGDTGTLSQLGKHAFSNRGQPQDSHHGSMDAYPRFFYIPHCTGI